ncbi:hypothetical protein PC129_g24612, partial [Phytophthora cactorum]
KEPASASVYPGLELVGGSTSMPRGKGFSELEQGQMLGLCDSCLSYDAIAERLKRSETGIYQVLKNPEA